MADTNCELCHERPGHAVADAWLCDTCEKIMDPDVMAFYGEQNKADLAKANARLAEIERLRAELERVTSERNVSREAAKMYFEHREKEHSARVASERELDTLRQRWESGPALDALDGVLEAAVDGIDEYAVKYQGIHQEYIDTIRRDIRTVQAAQRAARGDDQQAERGQAENG